MTLDARQSAHQRAMVGDPAYRAWYTELLEARRRQTAAARVPPPPRRARPLVVEGDLPMPRVYLRGPRCWRFCRDSQPDPDCWRAHVYDFAVDVRELVCEPLGDRIAMWADPRERLPVNRPT